MNIAKSGIRSESHLQALCFVWNLSVLLHRAGENLFLSLFSNVILFAHMWLYTVPAEAVQAKHTCQHPNPKNSVLNQALLPLREELGGHVGFHALLSIGITCWVWRQAEQETPGRRGASELFLYTLLTGKYHLLHSSKKHLCYVLDVC